METPELNQEIVPINFKGLTLWERIKYNKECYFMIMPFMFFFTLFIIVPLFVAVAISFTSFDMINTPTWRGWENYIELFLNDDVFLVAVSNTLIFSLVTGPISYCACLILAWLINEFPRRIRTILTFLFYIPSISGGMVFIWSFIFSGDMYGLINSFLMKFNFIDTPIQWLTDSNYAFKIVMIVQIWMSLGTSFLAFIAGLQGVDRNMYEAGYIDGIKSRWQELIYITLPSIGPQLMFGAIMQISASFSIGAMAAGLVGFPSVDNCALTIVQHANDYGNIRFEMGYATAISVILTITMLVTNKIIQKILRKFTNF